MYKRHFGLLKKPFELSPDSNILFLGENHKKALAVMKQGVISDSGFLLLTGGVGTGKTTLINVLSLTLENPGYLCVLSNPTLDIDDFYTYLAEQLGLLFDGNRAKFLFLFSKLLEESGKTGRKVLLIVDEAHVLPSELLEELRLLVAMTTGAAENLNVFLVGQPELVARLSGEQLAPLNAAIGVRFHLDQLSEGDTLQYILFRLNRAGSQNNNLFTEGALASVYKATGGNPRLVNILCDNALLSAYANDSLAVKENDIRESVEQLRLQKGDDAFGSIKGRSEPKSRLVWLVLIMVLISMTAGLYSFQQGWLWPVYRTILQLLNMG